MKKSFKIFAACLVAGLTFTSCNTDVESVTLDQPNVANRYPELYATYLQNLRNYRSTSHKQTYAWFDNSATQTYSRYQHITDVPDSVDVLVLTEPDNVTSQMNEEMATVRTDKGMKVIYDVDFDEIKDEYTDYEEGIAAKNLANGTEEEPISFQTFLMQTMEKKLGYCETYGFDGIMICYNGKETHHLSQTELATYKEQEGMFMGIISDWMGRHTDKFYAFNGKPQNVADKTLFNNCKMVFCSEGASATNRDMWTIYLTQATQDGVPADKLGMTVSCTSLSDDDIVTGWFSDGSRAIASMGQWAYYADVAGVGVKNISSDYFNNTYSYSRAMIQAMVPAGSK